MKKKLNPLFLSLILATSCLTQNAFAQDYTGLNNVPTVSLVSIISVAVVTSPLWGPSVLISNGGGVGHQTTAEAAFANQKQVVIDKVNIQNETAQWVFKRPDDSLIEIETPVPTQSTLPQLGQTLVVQQTDLGIALTQQDTVWFYFYNQKGQGMMNHQKL